MITIKDKISNDVFMDVRSTLKDIKSKDGRKSLKQKGKRKLEYFCFLEGDSKELIMKSILKRNFWNEKEKKIISDMILKRKDRKNWIIDFNPIPMTGLIECLILWDPKFLSNLYKKIAA